MRRAFQVACLGVAVLSAPLHAQDVGRLYSQSELASAGSRYAPNLRGLWDEDFLTRLAPGERQRAGKVTLLLPLMGARRSPLDFYSSPPERQVFLPIASVKFLDDMSIAIAYHESRGCGMGAVSDYVGLLRTQSSTMKGSPRDALGVPANALGDKVVDDVSQKLLKSMVYFIVAHEFAHVMYQHKSYKTIGAQEAQRQETEADGFALEVMRRIAVPPLSMVHFFTLVSRLETSPADFETLDQYEAFLRQGATHPVSAQRIFAVADALQVNVKAFAVLQSNPAQWEVRLLQAVRDLRAIGATLDDRAMRQYLTYRAQTINPASLRVACQQ